MTPAHIKPVLKIERALTEVRAAIDELYDQTRIADADLNYWAVYGLQHESKKFAEALAVFKRSTELKASAPTIEEALAQPLA